MVITYVTISVGLCMINVKAINKLHFFIASTSIVTVRKMETEKSKHLE